MVHGPDPWWAIAVRLMLKYRNLRLMTSAWSPKLPPALLHYLWTRGLRDGSRPRLGSYFSLYRIGRRFGPPTNSVST